MGPPLGAGELSDRVESEALFLGTVLGALVVPSGPASLAPLFPMGIILPTILAKGKSVYWSPVRDES